ncbi:uncharacterized protein LOC111881823 [Lactuca sativa]|uniref:uncharacterized protein LOC111881823 n=1 Tax=Lactuca sativa TaxID=4236 RepID=UPI000CD99A6A|nr:uncharacterized protein LOC111881823 [Lactuca sativa]
MASVSCNSFVNSDCQKWVVDSGANQHMTTFESLLRDHVDVSKLNPRVSHPNGSSAQINKVGNLQLSNSLKLFDVFVVLEFKINLVSIQKLCKDTFKTDVPTHPSQVKTPRKWNEKLRAALFGFGFGFGFAQSNNEIEIAKVKDFLKSRSLIKDLEFSEVVPINLFCDNDSTIKLALNPVFHDKTKQFEIDVHFIREKITDGIISLVKVGSANQIADILTKSLSSFQHNNMYGKMCLIDPFFVNLVCGFICSEVGGCSM